MLPSFDGFLRESLAKGFDEVRERAWPAKAVVESPNRRIWRRASEAFLKLCHPYNDDPTPCLGAPSTPFDTKQCVGALMEDFGQTQLADIEAITTQARSSHSKTSPPGKFPHLAPNRWGLFFAPGTGVLLWVEVPP